MTSHRVAGAGLALLALACAAPPDAIAPGASEMSAPDARDPRRVTEVPVAGFTVSESVIGWRTDDPEGALRAELPREGGVSIARPEGAIQLEPIGAGRDGAALAPVEATERGEAWIAHRRAAFTERYDHGPRGLQQSFVLERRPPGVGEVRVAQRVVGGTLRAVAADEVVITPPRGEAIRYRGLAVWDADGRALPARMEVSEGRLDLVVHDEGARYPVVVDPWIVTEGYEDRFFRGLFGAALAMDEARAIVGAYDAPGGGRAAIYERVGETWSEVESLRPSSPSSNARFGFSADIDGDRAVVGAPNARAAYVFARQADGSWAQEAVLQPPSPEAELGTSVAIDGTTVAVGATGGMFGPGAVHVYVRGGGGAWTEQAVLPGDAGRPIGAAVALDGNLLAASALRDGAAGFTGAVYVFLRSAGVWTREAKITPEGVTGELQFGRSLAIDAGALLVGAPLDGNGAAHYHVRGGGAWPRRARLVASDGASGDELGRAVALEGGVAFVGAWLADSQAGATYVFEGAGASWAERDRLTASVPAAGERFGRSVAVRGGRGLVGAIGSNTLYAVRLFLDLGDACADGAECLSGECVDGVCCDVACGGGAGDDCVVCDGSSGGEVGTCEELAPGVACGDPSDSECDGADACVAGGFCASRIAAVGAPCGDPAEERCDGADACDGAGRCDPHLTSAGTPCGDASATECDRPDVCDGAGSCDPSIRPLGAPCGASDEPCRADACDGGGGCVAEIEATGTPCGDATECAGPGACDEGACVAEPLASGTPCGDGPTACSAADACDGEGACDRNDEPAGTPCGSARTAPCDAPDACDGAGACDPRLAEDGAACGDFCPTADRCASGACVPGPLRCDVGEACDPGGEACVTLCGNGRLDPGEACDDGPDNGDTPDACRVGCRLATCGDGVVDTQEACDDGPGGSAVCSTDCAAIGGCGCRVIGRTPPGPGGPPLVLGALALLGLRRRAIVRARRSGRRCR